MHTRTLILLLGLVACALAARGGGGGGGGRGGRGWGRSGPGGFGPGGFGRGGRFGGVNKAPQSCADDAEKSKQCFADNVKSKGVTIDIDSVKSCFESCQRPARPEGGDAARGNRTKGNWGGERHGKGERNGTRGGGGWGGRHGNGTGAHGNFTQMGEQMKTYGECLKNKMGDKQEQCVKSKLTYAVVTRDEQQQGGKGGRRGGFGGFGNPLKSLKEKADKCGAETTACLREKMGEWFEKTDELSQILCDASKACPRTTSDACKADRKAGRLAACQCREEMQPLKDQAQKDCTTDANREFVEKMSQRGKGKGEHKQRSCDAQENDDSDENDNDDKERLSPFCPKPEGSSKQRFAKRG